MAIVAGNQALASDVLLLKTYVEIAPSAAHQVTNSDTWEDWDISAIVPASTKCVLVGLLVFLNGENNGVRKNGSAVDRRSIFALGGNAMMRWDICECDTNRVIECYDDNVGEDGEFYIMGYWKDE